MGGEVQRIHATPTVCQLRQTRTGKNRLRRALDQRLHHNLFFTYQQHYGFAEPADSAGTIDVYENYFARDSISAGTIGYLAHINNTSNKRVTVRDNHYSKQGQVLPLAVITTNVVEGTVPLKVSFRC